MKQILFFLAITMCTREIGAQSAVTYGGACGRFGDQLMAYIHAKWVAYSCDLPLLYKPFEYSTKLMLHGSEVHYRHGTHFDGTVLLTKKFHGKPVGTKESVLYVVPYFPESKYELMHSWDSEGRPWQDFAVDWQDAGFIEELRRVIAPIAAVPVLDLPKNCITVAVHVRRGGYYDDRHGIAAFPLKFLPDEFFIEHIIQVYNLLGGRPLYVYIFTDDLNPTKIRDRFKKHCKGLDIQFACREHTNSDRVNVIEDFFSLQQFDCLIHSESNYSVIASKLGDYIITICPHEFRREKSGIIYDVSTIIRGDCDKIHARQIINNSFLYKGKK